VQQPGSALSVEVANDSEKVSTFRVVRGAWPIWVALAAWLAGWLSGTDWKKSFARILGWSFLAWAALRLPNGVPWFLSALMAFLLIHVLLPALRRLWSLPPKSLESPGRGAPALAAILVGSLAWLGAGCGTVRAAKTAGLPSLETVSQQIRVEDRFALGTVKLRWRAEKGQTLPVLFEPAVLTRIAFPKDTLKLGQATVNEKRVQQLTAERSGTFDIEIAYQLAVTKRDNESGISLPLPHGLVNQVSLTVSGLDV